MVHIFIHCVLFALLFLCKVSNCVNNKTTIQVTYILNFCRRSDVHWVSLAVRAIPVVDASRAGATPTAACTRAATPRGAAPASQTLEAETVRSALQGTSSSILDANVRKTKVRV